MGRAIGRRAAAAGAAAASLLAFLCSCSFDYGPLEAEEDARPDLTMDDVEYVRVRDGEPVVRVQAERVKRYERSQSMRIDRLRFEQYAADGKKAEAAGSAGAATVLLESGDADLSGGVQIVIQSEDLVIETDTLSWRDQDRLLVGGRDTEVLLKRSDGAVLSGRGFTSDARRHSWEFSGPVSGTYIDEDEDEAPKAAAPAQNAVPGEAAAAAP